jgi:segregation and condensation protein A
MSSEASPTPAPAPAPEPTPAPAAAPVPAPAEYKVTLDNYYGPLDLLLHLVKETEVDITAITLSRACEQYIQFLTAMEKLDLSLSGNFLALASQLLLIKSRTIAPPEVHTDGDAPEDEEELEGDASLELIRKLLDYKRFKDRSRALDRLSLERSMKVSRAHIRLEGETEVEPLRNLELWDLVLLYSKVMKGVRLDAMLSILYRDVPLEVFIERIQATLREKRRTTLAELLGERPDRTQILGTFLGILQLAKMQEVTVEQDEDMGEIRVEIREDAAGAGAPASTLVSEMARGTVADPASPAPPKPGEPLPNAYRYSVIDDLNTLPVPLSERPEAAQPTPEPPPAP